MSDEVVENVEAEATEAAVVERTPEERRAEQEAALEDIFNQAYEKMPENLKDHSIEHAEAIRSKATSTPESDVVDETEAVTDEEAESEDDQESELEEPEFKTLQFKRGDEVIEVPEDAVIQVKVDGELVDMPLSEVQNGLSGQKAIAQKFSALDAERKALNKQQAVWNEGREKVLELANNGQSLEAMDYIMTQAGINSDTFVSSFFEQISGPLEKYMSLSPEEQAVWAEQVKSERSRLQYEQVMQENQQLTAEREQLKAVRRIQTQHGLDDAQFADLYTRLHGEMEVGTIDTMPITADVVGQYHVLLNRENMVREALSTINERFASDDAVVGSILTKANARARAGESVTQEDVLQLVNETYGMEPKVKHAKAVKQSLEKKGNSKALEAEISKTPEDKSHRGGGDPNRHFLQSLNEELSSATSAEERQKILKARRGR